MASVKITFGRGQFEYRTRTINERYDATHQETHTLRLNSGDTFEMVLDYTDRYYVGGVQVEQQQFWEQVKLVTGFDDKLWDVMVQRSLDKWNALYEDMRAFGYYGG